MHTAPWIAAVLETIDSNRRLAEGAIAQLTDEELMRRPADSINSVAVIMRHIAGNLISRWSDFLTTDGEKPDRHRDTEFERGSGETRETILARWEAGWNVLFGAITSLTPADLGKTVTIRNEPHTVVQAINRQLSHYSAHVGQIVLLAKHFAGPNWKTLSIPKRKTGG